MVLRAPDPIRPTPVDSTLALAASVFYHSCDAIMITDLDGTILAVNRAFSAITGYAEHEVLGHNPRMFKSGRQGRDFYVAMWDSLTRQGHWQGEAWNRRKDGSQFVERITISTAFDNDGRPHHYIAVFADVTSASEQQRLLEERSKHDALTGLPNRLLLRERLDRMLDDAHTDQHPVALAFIDLDGFKAINDNFGHSAGDALLAAMAQRLQHALRGSDTLARIGGDEFVAALPDMHDDAVLDALVRRMLAAARAPLAVGGHTVQLSASIGVAMFPRDGDTAEQLISCADAAMYAAKRSGRDCVRGVGTNGFARGAFVPAPDAGARDGLGGAP